MMCSQCGCSVVESDTTCPGCLSSLAPRASAMGVTHWHFCIDIAGALKQSDRKLAAMFTDKGQKPSGQHVREWLKLELARGKRVLPMCDLDECKGFSYQTGCPGHPGDLP